MHVQTYDGMGSKRGEVLTLPFLVYEFFLIGVAAAFAFKN